MVGIDSAKLIKMSLDWLVKRRIQENWYLDR